MEPNPYEPPDELVTDDHSPPVHPERYALDDPVLAYTPLISSKCEVCGTASDFPASQDGTTQNCPKCNEFMDIGSLNWPDYCEFKDVETAPKELDNADDAIDAATKLDKLGEWDGAIVAYRTVSARWPEHTTYIANCIANVQRKIDANR